MRTHATSARKWLFIDASVIVTQPLLGSSRESNFEIASLSPPCEGLAAWPQAPGIVTKVLVFD